MAVGRSGFGVWILRVGLKPLPPPKTAKQHPPSLHLVAGGQRAAGRASGQARQAGTARRWGRGAAAGLQAGSACARIMERGSRERLHPFPALLHPNLFLHKAATTKGGWKSSALIVRHAQARAPLTLQPGKNPNPLKTHPEDLQPPRHRSPFWAVARAGLQAVKADRLLSDCRAQRA